jgi:hypothetical protein
MGRILRLVTVATMALGATPAAAASNVTISYTFPAGGLYSIGFDHVVGTRTVGYPVYFEFPGSTFNNNPVMPSPVSVTPVGTQVRMEIYRRCTLSTPGNYKACTSGTYRYEPTLGDSAVALRLTVKAQVNIGNVVFPNGHERYAARLRATVTSRTPLANNAFRISLFQTSSQPHTNTGVALDAFAVALNSGTSVDSGNLWNGRYIVFVTDRRNPAAPRSIKGYITLQGNTSRVFNLDAPCFGVTGCTRN